MTITLGRKWRLGDSLVSIVLVLFDLKHTSKMSGRVAYACSASTREAERGGFLGLGGRLSYSNLKAPASRESCLKTQGEYLLRNDTQR